MTLAKTKSNGTKEIKLALVCAGSFLLSIPQVFQPPKAEAIEPIPIDCRESFGAETPNYYVNICYNKNGSFYVGRAKDGSGSVVLPASYRRIGIYVATNGQHTYTLDENNHQLIITLPNGQRSIEQIIRIIDS